VRGATLGGAVPYTRVEFRRPLLPDGSDGLRLEVRAFLREQDFEPALDAWLSGFDPGSAAASRPAAGRPGRGRH
jgi:hypothetical protein